jgi:hypothetical protein
LGWRLFFLASKWREASFGYMNDVQVLGDDPQDIVRVNLACRDLKADSGTLLNRNCKTTSVKPRFQGWLTGLASAVASGL